MQDENYSQEFGEYIKKRLSHYPIEYHDKQGILTLIIAEKDLYNVLSFLQHDTHCRFERLENIYVAAYESLKKKTVLRYVLQNMQKQISILLETAVVDSVRSVTEIFKSAHWLEREIWEKHNILFEGHKDLRRLYIDINGDFFTKSNC